MPGDLDFDVDDAKFTISNPAALTKYKGAADIARSTYSPFSPDILFWTEFKIFFEHLMPMIAHI